MVPREHVAPAPMEKIHRIDADPKTTMRYDRARKNLDRHPNYILAEMTTAGGRPCQQALE